MTQRTRVRRVEGVLPGAPVVGAVLLAVAAIVLVSELEPYRLIAIDAVCLIGFALTREDARSVSCVRVPRSTRAHDCARYAQHLTRDSTALRPRGLEG